MRKVTLDSQNSGAGFSPALWKNIDWEDVARDMNKGVFSFFKMQNVLGPHSSTSGGTVTERNGPFSLFLSQGGAIANGSSSAANAGVVCSADGDNEAVVIAQQGTPFKIAYGGKPLVAEFRFKTSTIDDSGGVANRHGFVLGLSEGYTPTAVLPITAAGAIGDKNIVGFHRLESDGDKMDTIYKADGVTQVNVQTDAVTLVADTFKKVGMHFDGRVLRFYDDGVLLSSSKTIPSAAGTDFPNDVALGLIFGMVNATASSPGSVTLDWMAACQLI